MLSSLQLNTSAHRPIKTARGSVPVRFAGQDKKDEKVSIVPHKSSVEGFFAKLDSFSKSIKGIHDFGPNPDDPYNNYDFAAKYQQLTQRAQNHYKAFSESLNPEDLERMKEEHSLGFVEEAGDMLFEATTLAAVRRGVFNDKTVAKWSKKALPAAYQDARAKKPFEDFLAEMDKEIPKAKAEKVEKQMDWDPTKAHEMMKLIAAKFTLMRSKNIDYDIWDNNKKLLNDEGAELREAFPWYSPRQAQIWLLAKAYTNIPNLPLKYLETQLQGIVNSKFKTPSKADTAIKTEDMLQNVFAKQCRRQEFDYQNPQHTENKNRKEVLKGIEVLNEAAILQNARNGHPREIPVF